MSRAMSILFAALATIAGVVVALLVLVAFARLAYAEQVPGSPFALTASDRPIANCAKDREQIIIDVDRGIRFVLASCPCWGLAANSVARREMAEKIAFAAERCNVPPLLLTVIAKRESSFDPEAVGSLGEIGILQVHGLAAKDCDLSTVDGQLACGASWLRKSFDKCGTWDRAIAAYAAGYCTAPKNSRLFKLVFSRFRQWQRAEDAIGSCRDGGEHWFCKPQQRTCNEAIRVVARARTSKGSQGARLFSVQAP